MDFKKIMVMGDVHGEFGKMNAVIQKHKPEIILQCGDFGYWPKFTFATYPKIPDGTKLYFCDGNHEDHWELKKLNNNEVFPNCFYMKRGSVLTVEKQNILFMGGAESIDKSSRTIGIDWFPEETINFNDVFELPDTNIDIIISHTCPNEFDIPHGSNIKLNDPSRYALSYALEKYRPSKWYFGHWHLYKNDIDNKYQCEWYCLNMARWTNWWIWI